MIKIYEDLEQGTPEWLNARLGIITASCASHLLTSTLKVASNAGFWSYMYQLIGERMTKYVELQYVSDDMERGHEDEITARIIYNKEVAPVKEVGFITNDFGGAVRVGYSPDGLVGDDGLIEIKSRLQKHQVETLLNGEMPNEYLMQVQCGLLVSGRKYCDFISYCGGLYMVAIRVLRDPSIISALLTAAVQFENELQRKIEQINVNLTKLRVFPTVRLNDGAMVLNDAEMDL